MKCQEQFSAQYDKSVNDLSMSEGLGQKYGAPRRRAQERIRTEVGRDEQSAGKIDELLAVLDFICAESQRKKTTFTDYSGASPDSPSKPEQVHTMVAVDGKYEINNASLAWHLLLQVRLGFSQRVNYLRVVETALQVEPLPWLPVEKVKALGGVSMEESEEAAKLDHFHDSTAPRLALMEVMDEVDANCRQETRDLYGAEGKLDLLGDSGVPDSLELWLGEAKEKILGSHGHREKAWKRLWAQILRSEAIFQRVQEEVPRTMKEHSLNDPDELDETGMRVTMETLAIVAAAKPKVRRERERHIREREKERAVICSFYLLILFYSILFIHSFFIHSWKVFFMGLILRAWSLAYIHLYTHIHTLTCIHSHAYSCIFRCRRSSVFPPSVCDISQSRSSYSRSAPRRHKWSNSRSCSVCGNSAKRSMRGYFGRDSGRPMRQMISQTSIRSKSNDLLSLWKM